MIVRLRVVGIVLVGLGLGSLPRAAVEAGDHPRPTPASVQTSVDPRIVALYRREQDLFWSGDETAVARRRLALRLLERERRLDPSAGVDPVGLGARFEASGRSSLAAADRALSRAWLGYLSRRRGSLDGADPRLFARILAVLETPVGEDELASAAVELAIVEALGGWRPVGARFEPLVSEEAIDGTEATASEPPRRRLIVDTTDLRKRLVQSLDLPARYLGAEAPQRVLSEAIRRFQGRHGLVADGVAGPRTLAALREPVAVQLARVRRNLTRSAELGARTTLRRYVEVNIPAFELRLVENGKVTLRSKVIVGDEKTPTPVFDDVIRYIEIDPAWYVPVSIVPELLARNQKDPGYLERAGFVWRTSENGTPRLIQRPGPENALGRFKFVFPNHHAVYLHDTAQRGLFGRPDRALSHGCVRVERPFELALALLAEQGWDAARLEQVLATRRSRRIELVDPVPVFLDYRTAEIDPEGRLRLTNDLYGRDAPIILSDASVPPPDARPGPRSSAVATLRLSVAATDRAETTLD